VKTFLLIVVACAFSLAAGCSSAKTGSVPPTRAGETAPAHTPTPGLLSRVNPNVVEETETYTIQRFPKNEVIRVDDRHIRHPLVGTPVEFFKEDEGYYYVYVPKRIPEEEALKREAEEKAAKPSLPPADPSPTPASSPVSLADFSDLQPPRVSGRLRLEEVSDSGLPTGGMWRASFVVADMNGDRIPDIVSPPARVGGSLPQVWTGSREGRFSEWPLTFTEGGKRATNFSVAYGGLAVGDIDGDARLDIVSASHGGGLVSLFGNGQGSFEVVRGGLPGKEFSAQAIVLLDADRDGKLDMVASRDILSSDENPGTVDRQQVRVYLFRGLQKGWEFKQDGLVGGFYSNSLHAWDHDGDGRRDVLTGSHYAGALTLLWKNEGNGTFSPVSFPAVEIYAYHFVTVPGTFGKERVPAFADGYLMFTNEPEVARATGITVYSFKKGAWSRHRLWRKKEGTSFMYGIAMGDLDGDGLDDVVFPDSEARRLKVFFQRRDGTFEELSEKEEPALDSPGQCVRLADVSGDGRLDVLLAKTVSSVAPEDPGGWSVYINRK